MQCLLYIPQYECDGLKEKAVASVRIGGLTLFERACRSIERANFDEILLVNSAACQIPLDARLKIPCESYVYQTSPDEVSDEIAQKLSDEGLCICVLDGMVSPECLKMRPRGADVRIATAGELTGIYFVGRATALEILHAEHGLDVLESHITETLQAPEQALYHRMLSKEDIKIAQNMLTKSLRKPLGRDADGLVAYFINRPCSLQISKRIANSPITPNMITCFGLILGLGAAGLVATGQCVCMVIGAILWQISSMVDGIDGELARMRMSPSHSGEWFDTVADDVTNITFMLGLGCGMWQSGANFPFMDANSAILYFQIAVAVCIFMVIAVLWFYREFIKMGIASHNHFEWGFESENKDNKGHEHRSWIRKTLDKIAGGFAWIAKRDFYTFLIMCLILCNFNKAAYFIMLTGASFVGIGSVCALSLRAIRNFAKKKK